MTVVLDASAVLALAGGEPGAQRVRQAIGDSLISAVNFAEVGTRLLDIGGGAGDIVRLLRRLGLNVVPFDEEAAAQAVHLRHATRQYGLSLGDRACLALAIRQNATALTADRAWAALDVGCRVELIR